MEKATKYAAFAFLCLASRTTATGTPVLLWSPEKSMTDLPDTNGETLLSSDNFLGDFLNPLFKSSADSGIVFLQDKLHVDDFTKFADVYSLDSDGGAFKNVKSLVEDLFSAELPGVDNPFQAVEKLKTDYSGKGKVHEVNSLEELEKLDLSRDEKFLVVVHLSPLANEVDQEKVIKENDAMVGKMCGHLQKHNIPYTALFTGKTSPDVVDDRSESSFSGRHLLQDVTADLPANSSTNGTFMNVTGMFIFMRRSFLCLKMSNDTEKYCPTNFTLIPTNDTAADSTKPTNTTAMITLKWTGLEPNNKTGSYDIQLDMNTTNLGDRWQIVYMSLTTSGGEPTISNATLTMPDLDTSIPYPYSFHCSEFVIGVDAGKNNSEYKGTYIKLNGFQMQPFNVKNNTFFNAQDCVGFFTRGTWMGLFPTLILISILIFGTLMVLNLSTMDKYDDPKGKTITVPQSND